MKIEHILLTTDLSNESMLPAAAVADLARTTGARVTLLNVVEELLVAPHGAPLAPPVTSPDTAAEIARAEENIASFKDALGADVKLETAVIAAGSAAKAIARWAKEHGVDLIALSTHGRTGIRHLAMGSVAESVLRHSKVPVLCFPQSKKKGK
jgi:nucleotide-binding universal stress UspA family protein